MGNGLVEARMEGRRSKFEQTFCAFKRFTGEGCASSSAANCDCAMNRGHV